MKKYLQYLKSIKIFLLLLGILCCCNQQGYSQNIRLKIERLGLRIYDTPIPTNCWDVIDDIDCGGLAVGCAGPFLADPVVNNKLIISGVEYLLPEFRGYEFLGVCSTSPTLETQKMGWFTKWYNHTDIHYCDCTGPFCFFEEESSPPPTK